MRPPELCPQRGAVVLALCYLRNHAGTLTTASCKG